MGCSHIKWNKKAQVRFEEIAAWYACNMGRKAAMNFASGIYDTLITVSHSPTIGILDRDRSNSRVKYYSFLSHPKYRIIYRFTKTSLYVVAIQATMMKHN